MPSPQTEQPPSGISGQGVGRGATGAGVTGAGVTTIGAEVASTGASLGTTDGRELPLGLADGNVDPEGTASCAYTVETTRAMERSFIVMIQQEGTE